MADRPQGVRLGAVATIKARLGWKGLKAEEYQESGYYFLSTPTLKGDRINFGAAQFVSRWRYEESPEIQLRVGDVLLVKDGSTLGIANLVRNLPGPATLNGSIALVRCGDHLEPLYLLQCVRGGAFQNLIRLKKSGLGVPHLFQADLREFEIGLPSLPEQRQIAAILDTIDDDIRKTEQIIAKLNQVKQGLLHDLLTRGIDDNGELRDPERHPEQFKESALGRIPRGWEAATLGAHLSGSPQNGLYKPGSHYGDAGTAIVRIDGFYDGALNHVSTFKRVRLTEAETAMYQLDAGNILINRVNSIDYVGKAALVPQLDETVTFESNIMRLRLEQRRVEPAYVIRALCAQPARRFFFTRAKSAIAQASVNQTDVREAPLLVPDLDEQKRIVELLDTFEARLAAEAVGLGKTRLLRSALMEDLLTGRVRVTRLLSGAAL
jgi:type I restriction enzyme, S subunit